MSSDTSLEIFDTDPDVLISARVSKTFRKGQYIGPRGLAYFAGQRIAPFLPDAYAQHIAKLGEPYETFQALDEAAITIKRGEKIGIVGLNGAGKTTFLKILSGVMTPTEGDVRSRGRIVPILGIGAGFNIEMSGYENIKQFGLVLGLTPHEINEALPEIVAFSELEGFLDTPLKRYSKGMRARLSMAVAFHIRPDLLIIDEVLAVGDVPFRAKCMEKINEITATGVALLFVSHSLVRIKAATERCLIMRKGQVVFDDTTAAAAEVYRNVDLASIGVSETDIDDEDVGEISPVIQTFQKFEGAAEAPVCLEEVSVVGSVNNESGSYFFDEELVFKISFIINDPDLMVFPRLKFFTEHGDLIFSSIWPDGEPGVTLTEGQPVQSVLVVVPGYTFNPGFVSIGVGLFTYAPIKKIVNTMTDITVSISPEKSVPTDPELTFSFKERAGIVSPKLTWKLEEEGVQAISKLPRKELQN